MAYGDQFKDTPENRQNMQRAAEHYADMKGVVYVVTRDKSSGNLGALPKSMFDPEREVVIFECSGGGERAADERWEAIFRRLEGQAGLADDGDG
jgi:hypothetical protein